MSRVDTSPAHVERLRRTPLRYDPECIAAALKIHGPPRDYGSGLGFWGLVKRLENGETPHDLRFWGTFQGSHERSETTSPGA